MKQAQSGRERPVGDTVHDGTPQVTALADAKAQDNAGIHHAVVAALGGVPRVHHATLIPQAAGHLAAELAERGRLPVLLIDEAHLLSHDQLEAIRMLTSAQLDSASPLAVLLLGQPQLRASMRLGVLAALVISSLN